MAFNECLPENFFNLILGNVGGNGGGGRFAIYVSAIVMEREKKKLYT